MKNLIRLFPLLIIASLMLAACGAKAPGASETSESGVMPTSLQTIEAAAEDIIDIAPANNWEKISADVTDIENAWKAYQPQADKAGASREIQEAMSSALAELQAASTAKDPAVTMQSSNNVSAAVIELFALYHPTVPVDIGRLDVLERQIILDIAAKDYSAAATSLAKTTSVWREVKPSVLEHNGEDVAAQFESSLEVQAAAVNSKNDTQLTDEARNALEIVDALELLY